MSWTREVRDPKKEARQAEHPQREGRKPSPAPQGEKGKGGPLQVGSGAGQTDRGGPLQAGAPGQSGKTGPSGKPDPAALAQFARTMAEKYHIGGSGDPKADAREVVPERKEPAKQPRGPAVNLQAIPIPERTKPNRAEHEFMINLILLRAGLAAFAEQSEARLKQVNRYARRDLRLLWSLVSRLQDQMIATMPPTRQDYYYGIARNYRYEVVCKGPHTNERYMQVHIRNLEALGEGCLRGECATCFREGDEIRKCDIRKAMMEFAPPEKVADEKARWITCEYREAAGKLTLGEHVTL